MKILSGIFERNEADFFMSLIFSGIQVLALLRLCHSGASIAKNTNEGVGENISN